MNIEEYQRFKYLVDTYFEHKHGQKRLLQEIRHKLNTKKSIRKQLIKEIENNERYIELFSIEYQIKICVNILNRETHHKFEISKIVLILLFVSNKALNPILRNIDSNAISDLVYEIKGLLRNAYQGETKLFEFKKSKKYSKFWKRKTLKRLCKKCEKYNK